ncbi:hypothetical protein N0V95_006377 [Ascochyta clinopodiicola]|nr:hypothetical protein N0V95_006377 [Ascochyta clinopodiicola]
MAESISEGTLTSLQRKINDNIEANDEIATIETDKIDVTVDAPESGRIVEFLVAEGDTVVVGQKVAVIETDAAKIPAPNEGEKMKKDYVDASNSLDHQDSDRDPVVLKDQNNQFQPPLAAQEENQRQQPLKAQDTMIRCSPMASLKSSSVSQQDTQKPSAVKDRSHKEKAVPMPRMRLTIAKRLKDSQNLTASLTAMQQVDITALMQFRKLHKENVLQQFGVRLGYMGAFVRAATLAALEVPEINASMSTEDAYITYRDYVDISVAVSTPKGLVTPVLRSCESKDIVAIEKEIASFAKKARDGKLEMKDIAGGNFTISNPGIFGSLFGTPVINYPQSAVFNMNSIRDEPVVINDQIVVRPVMYITITYDHRLIDGREASQFLNVVKSYIEDPARMLLTCTRE